MPLYVKKRLTCQSHWRHLHTLLHSSLDIQRKANSRHLTRTVQEETENNRETKEAESHSKLWVTPASLILVQYILHNSVSVLRVLLLIYQSIIAHPHSTYMFSNVKVQAEKTNPLTLNLEVQTRDWFCKTGNKDQANNYTNASKPSFP